MLCWKEPMLCRQLLPYGLSFAGRPRVQDFQAGTCDQQSSLRLPAIRQQVLSCIAGVKQPLAAVQEGQLDHNIDRMRYTMMDLLTRLGKAFRSRRASTVFSINNFNHVVTVSLTHCSCLQVTNVVSARQRCVPSP